MRMPIPDLSRVKATAKALARLSSTAKLATVQEALARALGYRDWHELSVSTVRAASAMKSVDLLGIVLSLSEVLELDPGDVQYVLDKTRLLSAAPLSLEDHLGLSTAIWRRRFGPAVRGKPGAVVKVKTHGHIQQAYLLQAGRPTYLLFDTGPGSRADFEVSMPSTPLPDFVPSRLWLPYGYWTLTDGSEVIFSRDYFPLWRVTPDATQRVDPWLWINGIAAEHHFGGPKGEAWYSGPAREAALQHLAKQRVRALPRLASIMPHLLGSSVEKMASAVACLYAERGQVAVTAPYAQLNRRLNFG